MPKLYDVLNEKFPKPEEGISGNLELDILKGYTEGKKSVLEIGFNTGVSSAFFLENGAERVVSFDIAKWGHEMDAKAIIDEKFPGKHELVVGDSLKTVPAYETDEKFDLIFVDGYHWGIHPYHDIKNCREFAHEDTVLIIDNMSPPVPDPVISQKGWSVRGYQDVNRAWGAAAFMDKFIRPLKIDFRWNEGEEFGAGMAVCKYVLD